MEGVVDYPMRQILNAVSSSDRRCTNLKGIDACVTEFIRVNDHAVTNKVFYRSCPELLKAHTYPVRVQLLGSNPTALANSARTAAQLGAPAIDLNFGCPAKTVNKSRGGACLLDETPLIYEIVSAVRAAVPEDIPVTVKIRLGYEQRDSYLENALAIEKAGASELVVHARSKSDGYQPPAYWRYIGEIKQIIKIPVIANGEIWTVDDYFKCREQSSCDDVMLGRGLLAQPDLAIAIKAKLANIPYTPLGWSDIAVLVHQLLIDTSDLYPSKYTGNRVKQWLHYLQRHYPQAISLFHDIKRCKDRAIIAQRIKQDIGVKAP